MKLRSGPDSGSGVTIPPAEDHGDLQAGSGRSDIERRPPVAFVRRRRPGGPQPRPAPHHHEPLGSDPLREEQTTGEMRSTINRIVETLAEARGLGS
jgi:hypothetical protein